MPTGGEGGSADDAEIADREELADLLRTAVYPRPVQPTTEDYARIPPLPPDANDDDRDRAFKQAQAEALVRIARAEKARRQREGYVAQPEHEDEDH